jgi:molecular chaperone GrpE
MKFNDMLKKKKKDNPEVMDNTNEELNGVENAADEVADQDVENNIADAADSNEVKEPKAAGNEQTAEQKLKEELAQANDKYLRLYAEFDNFRRRTTKERIEQSQTAGKEVIVSLLPVLDDFERALKAMETATDIIPVKEGVALVQNKLNHLLTSKGLKQMETRGTAFDADIHEAITNIPAGDALTGKLVDEREKGYYLNDKVIRFAKVVVGS